MPAHFSGLRPLLGSEHDLHSHPDGAPRQDQIEPGGGGLVIEGTEPGFGRGRVLEGRPQVDPGMPYCVPPGNQVGSVFLTDGPDAGPLDVGLVPGPADPFGTGTAARSGLGRKRERQEGQD